MMRRLIRCLLACGLLASTFVYAMFQGGFTSWFLFSATATLVIYELLTARFSGCRLNVVRKLSSTRLTSGSSLQVEIEVAFGSRWPVVWLHVEDLISARLQLHSSSNRELFYPWFNRKQLLHYTISQIPRGIYTLSDIRIFTGDLFGLIKRDHSVRIHDEILVYPRTVPIPFWPSLNKFAPGYAFAENRQVNGSANVIGVRDYVPGDRLSRIHWKAAARTGTLKTKEFEYYATNDIVFVLGRHAGDYAKLPAAVFELAVVLVSSLLKYSYEMGFCTGLASYGKQRSWFPVHRQPEQYGRILEHLATVIPDGDTPLHEVVLSLSSHVNRGTTFVITCPVITAQLVETVGFLSQRKLKAEIFLVTGPRISSDSQREMIDKLSWVGARVYVIAEEQEIAKVVGGGSGDVARF